MKPAFFVVLCVFAGSAAASAINVERRSGTTIATLCPGSTVIKNTTVTVNGQTVTKSTVSCPGGLKKNPKKVTKKISSRELPALFGRNQAECHTFQPPQCQCGTLFECECDAVDTDAPASGDCNNLIDACSVFPQVTGPTFVVNTGTFEFLSFQSCGLTVSNESDEDLEFCFDELAAQLSSVNQNCFEGNDIQGAADCSPNSELWSFQATRVGA